MMPKCKRVFSFKEIKSFVNNGIFEKYVKFYNSQAKKINAANQNEILVYCPHPDCEESMRLDKFEINQVNKTCKLNHKFCYKCKQEKWHDDDICYVVYLFIIIG
jgi:IBR domain, a half RING-finger domain